MKFLAKELVKLTVLERNELSQILKRKDGIEDFTGYNIPINKKDKPPNILDLYLKESGRSKLATRKYRIFISKKRLRVYKYLVDKAPSLKK